MKHVRKIALAACAFSCAAMFSFGWTEQGVVSLSVEGADILAVTPDRSDSSSEEIKQVKVEIYTEKMTFEYATGLL